ncbi:response regulator transcription factor [bacterium]|nr:response regulator transcription factor [bacterium]
MIRVLVVEDHLMTRMGLVHAISLMDDIELVAEAQDGQEGVTFAKQYKPDVILMDIGLPKIDGIKATEMIREAQITSKILMFTSRDSQDDVFDSLSAGADGYIMKGTNEIQLKNAILAVNEGTAWLDPAIAKMVLSSIKKEKPQQSEEEKNALLNSYGLTERELETLQLIVDGYQNQEIADKLFISISTAKAHVHNILQKLYCKSRAQATRLAIKEGLV